MKVTDYLARDEIALLSRRSDVHACWTFAANWSLIAGAFAIAIAWPNILTISGAILIIAARQLGLGVLLHDCAHHAMFVRRRTNEVVGQWLAGTPINLSLAEYRPYHLGHHRHAGTPADPDLGFVASYPIAPAALRRKLLRDVSGRTGMRDLVRSLRQFKIATHGSWVAFHAGLFTVLALAGGWWAYGLWWAAQIFVYPAMMRLRQIGEHGVVHDRGNSDPRMNTATTLVSWWERLLLAPNHVNYHVEHHVAAGVPPYRLARMHRLLKSRGFFDGFDALSHGYRDVVRRATRSRPFP